VSCAQRAREAKSETVVVEGVEEAAEVRAASGSFDFALRHAQDDSLWVVDYSRFGCGPRLGVGSGAALLVGFGMGCEWE